MAEFIQKTDTLNQGREKLNAAITDAEKAKVDAGTAVSTSNQAKQIAQTAEHKADSVQAQFDQVVIEGDSSVEAAQARVSSEGTAYGTLKERLDTEHADVTSQLAQTEDKANLIRSYDYTGKLPAISFQFDDAPLTDWTRFRPIFESEGVPGNACVMTDWSLDNNEGNHLDLDQLKYLKELGWTISSHTHSGTKRLSQLSDSELDEELRLSHEKLKAIGMDADIIVYPFGDYDDRVIRFARKYYQYGIKTFHSYDHLNIPPEFDNMLIQRTETFSSTAGQARTLDELKAEIDNLLVNPDWLIFEEHSGYSFWQSQENRELLRQLIQYIKSKGIPIISIREGIEKFSNIIDVGDTENYHKVTRNGQAITSESVWIKSKDNAYDANNLITDFKKNHVTVTKITDPILLATFPMSANNEGMLETHYFDGVYQNWQYYTTGDFRFVRRGNAQGWQIFIRQDMIWHLPDNTYTNNSSVSAFRENCITIVKITDSEILAGFPTATSGNATEGLLETKRFGTYQNLQYFTIGNNDIYFRRGTTQGWQGWKRVVLEDVV